MKSTNVNIVLALLLAAATSQALPANAPTAAEWREDLHVLASELPRVHPNPFHNVPEAEWRAAVSKLDERLPSLDRDETIVELMRVVAMIGEGHTALDPIVTPPAGFHYLPISPYLFADGLYVRMAAPAHAELAGAKIVRIGKLTADDALRSVSAITPHDNDSGARSLAPMLAAVPEVLHGLGIVDDASAVPVRFEKGGRTFDVTFTDAIPLEAPSGHGPAFAAFRTDGWVDAAADSPRPLWLRDPHNLYWSSMDGAQKVFYIQYNAVADKPGDPISSFFPRAIAEAEASDATRLVIDVRENLGGSGFLNRPIVKSLIRSRFDRRGKLFVIIGRRTFSAGQTLVNDLEFWTDAMFVGEPTASNPSQYGDHTMVTLPHSGLIVAVSTVYHQSDRANDRRRATSPQLPAALTFADYRSGVDPAMNQVVKYRSIAEALQTSLRDGDAAGVDRAYRKFKSDPATSWIPTEGEMNALGYQLLNERKTNMAVLIFALNAESYPQSANVHDSLGEAYLMAGDKQRARASYQRAVELNPQNDNARRALEQLDHDK